MGERAFRSEVKGYEVTACAMGTIAMGTVESQWLDNFLFAPEPK